ncbi:MAG TPA: hypothetical protein DCZ10_16190 [Pelotomaculum sp.]|nr:hypothetical protein [Pelotomaculum sp.]
MITIDAELMQVNTILGNLFSDVMRAQEGTAAASHAAESLVENRWTAGMYSNLVSQDEIGDDLVTQAEFDAHLAEKASQSTLGHIKIGPAGSIDINGVYTPGGFKRVNATHDISVAGDQIINGVGFTPRAIIAFACVAGTSAASMGIHSGSSYSIVSDHVNIANAWSQGTGTLIELKPVAATIGYATVKSIDSDGCTLTWEKSGSPTGTAIFTLLFLK